MAKDKTANLNLKVDSTVAVQGIKDYGNASDSAVRKSGGLERGLKRVAAGFVGVAGVYKAYNFAKSAVKDYAALELEMANVSTMLNEQTMKFLPQYTKQVRYLSTQMGEATSSLSTGLYDILSASVSAEEALQVLEVSSRAAVGGITTTAVSADAITTILNSYNMASTEASKVSSDLFETVQRGKITFEQLASNIGKVSSNAAVAGIDLEELLGTVATLTRAGLSAEIAITSIKSAISSFGKPTIEGARAAKELGFELNASSLEALQMTGLLEKLKEANVTQLAAIMPNIQGYTALAAALKQVGSVAGDVAYIQQKSGADIEAQEKIMDTTTKKIDVMTQSWKNLKTEVGKFLAPKLTPVFQAMAEDLNAYTNTVDTTATEAEMAMARLMKVQYRIDQMTSNKALREMAGQSAGYEGAQILKGLVERQKAFKEFEAAMSGPGGPGMPDYQNTAELARGRWSYPTNNTYAAPAAPWGKPGNLPPAPEVEVEKTPTIEPSSANVDQMILDMQFERELLSKTNLEREKAVALKQAEDTAIAEGMGVRQSQRDLIIEEVEAMHKAKDLAEIGETIGNGFADGMSAVSKALMQGGDAMDAARGAAMALMDELLRVMVFQKIAQGIAHGIGGGGVPVPSSKGNVFSNGVIVPHSKGDIISTPSYFPMADGRTGSVAEGGAAEAIVPLAKGRGGKLGIESVGGGGSSETNIKIVNVLDPSIMEDYMASAAGEKAVLNIMRKNGQALSGAF